MSPARAEPAQADVVTDAAAFAGFKGDADDVFERALEAVLALVVYQLFIHHRQRLRDVLGRHRHLADAGDAALVGLVLAVTRARDGDGARLLPSAGVEAVVPAAAGAGVTLCAQPDTETASISAPSGSRAISDDGPARGRGDGGDVVSTGIAVFLDCAQFVRRERTGCAKMASKQGPAMPCAGGPGSGKKLGWLEITGWRDELAGAKSSLEVYIK